jgi:putative spermidine/putrescine transport system permease protein
MSGEHGVRTAEQRIAWTSTKVTAGLVFVFLMAPILAIMPLSFSSSIYLTYPLPGFSFRWYEEFLTSPAWMRALKNSMIIGVGSTILSMGLGTLAALGLHSWQSRYKPLVMAVVLSPMVVPMVITAVGAYFFFAPLGLTGNYLGLILVHAALAAPFVVVTVSATLQGFDTNLMRASASLGAPPHVTFLRVVLPLIAPGLASGALFAFGTSFDEVVCVLFLAGPEQRTLPREMFSGIRENISPTITAAAVVLTLFSVIFLATLEGLRRRNERLRGAIK